MPKPRFCTFACFTQISPGMGRDFNSLSVGAKCQKNAPSPLKSQKDFMFRGTWMQDLLWDIKYKLIL